jgi:predicted MFS family arabinose efflux permease
MTKHLGASLTLGSLALASFWAVATGARVGFAMLSRTLAPSTVFCVLPFVLAAAFAMLAVMPTHAPAIFGVAAFALAGLGISALLPLVLSSCERSIPGAATTATSVVFATYLFGYGVAAFGVGPLQDRGITLPAMDTAAIGLASVVAALAFAIVRVSGDHS